MTSAAYARVMTDAAYVIFVLLFVVALGCLLIRRRTRR
jgi:hypothetical protein